MEENMPYKPFDNGFASTSYALGIIALVSTLFVPFVIPCVTGGVAIILAVLSRGKSELNSKALTGITTGTVAIVINLLIVFAVVYLFLCSNLFRIELNSRYLEMFGYTFTDMINEYVGNGFNIESFYIR